MAAKYEALRDALRAAGGEVTWTFREIDAIVGGLPASARAHASWWGNTWAPNHIQSHAWLAAGYQVRRLDLSAARVTFIPGAPPRPTRSADSAPAPQPVARPLLDGAAQLRDVLLRAGYPSIMAAVAEHAVFLHPDTVAQAGPGALFPVARNMHRRGEFAQLASGRRVLLDDNTSPTLAFIWAAGRLRTPGVAPDVQFNHVWNDAANPDAYTALWNMCATPAFLAKTTDGSNHPDVVASLRYRAWELYGLRPNGQPEPTAPHGYEGLRWAEHPPPLDDLGGIVRARLRSAPKSPPAKASRTLGWYFSDWVPDATI